MNFPFWRSVFQKAIERGLAKGDVKSSLDELGDYNVKSAADARAICNALRELSGRPYNADKYEGDVRSLVGIFQEVEPDTDACEVLREEGTPELIRMVDHLRPHPVSGFGGEMMFILKILAMYTTESGARKIIEFAQAGVEPDGYMWAVIFQNFTAEHPETERVFAALSDPLPEGFMAVGLLDAANAALIGEAGFRHPFDSETGQLRLKAWLQDTDEDHFSYAHSATAAIPFISQPACDVLLEIALQHPDSSVRVEAAWAGAKAGNPSGFKQLGDFCLDWRTAAMAVRYLKELGREDVIPDKTQEPEFFALASFAEWLAHPNELGRYPDKLEIVDHRMLKWPPEREEKPFWLIKYTNAASNALEEESSECGLVGSMTFCLFSYNLTERPPEDGYAVHCYWELTHAKLIDETRLDEKSEEYASMLSQWKHGGLANAEMKYITECDPSLKLPQRVVGLASATFNDKGGWVVLDGNDSAFYPKDEMPEDSSDAVPLKIHIGRKLLGMPRQAERKRYLRGIPPAKDPRLIVEAYHSELEKALKLEGKKRERAFGSFSVLSGKFTAYVDACLKTDAQASLQRTIRSLAPMWEHNLGYTTLGEAAFQAGLIDDAECFLAKFRAECPDACRGETLDLLAEIWCEKGRNDDAKALLAECLEKLAEELKTAEGDERKTLAEDLEAKRQLMVRLFGKENDCDV
jgi:hypothetical protein